ncbi:hypothetical protein ACFVDI_04470 [Nocardioides sp. NPDC057767]|uniref:hypothetical protein n=1 Tax=unclassified Nocardioides TaxID=2615069 RepID=UPI00366B9782
MATIVGNSLGRTHRTAFWSRSGAGSLVCWEGSPWMASLETSAGGMSTGFWRGGIA